MVMSPGVDQSLGLQQERDGALNMYMLNMYAPARVHTSCQSISRPPAFAFTRCNVAPPRRRRRCNRNVVLCRILFCLVALGKLIKYNALKANFVQLDFVFWKKIEFSQMLAFFCRIIDAWEDCYTRGLGYRATKLDFKFSIENIQSYGGSLSSSKD